MSCANCKLNATKNIQEAVCTAVLDPLDGSPLPIKIARQERHPTFAWSLPCCYAGFLWEPKS